MGYTNPPWEFKGQALYQLSLVKIEQARKYVPADLPLVNFFGWTLGGFYLARYTHSPVGAFDELVALAGLVWNFPTSCAWAARVYVNNKEARNHGITSVGLPSRLAQFRAVPLQTLGSGGLTRPAGKGRGGGNGVSWWDVALPGSSIDGKVNSIPAVQTDAMELCNVEGKGLGRLLPIGGGRAGRGLSSPVCSIAMPRVSHTWSPRIQMFLPSFSGATPDFPGLLKYSLRLMANIRFLPPVAVRFPEERREKEAGSAEVLDAVLGGRPLVCMAFDKMEMEVQAPEAWAPKGARKEMGVGRAALA